MATLSIKDEQLFQIKAHMAELRLKRYSDWIDYMLKMLDSGYGIMDKVNPESNTHNPKKEFEVEDWIVDGLSKKLEKEDKGETND